MSGQLAGLPTGFGVSYFYNTDDQLTERDIYGVGTSPLVTDTYAYDGEGRPMAINESGSAVAAKSFGYTYVAPGQPLAGMLASVSRSLGGSQVLNTVYTYDSKERLTDIAHYGLGHSAPIAEYGYTFDTADRISSFGVAVNGTTQTAPSRVPIPTTPPASSPPPPTPAITPPKATPTTPTATAPVPAPQLPTTTKSPPTARTTIPTTPKAIAPAARTSSPA